MGHITHHVIIVTSWDSEALSAAREFARGLGLDVGDLLPSKVNSYQTFCVAPDGSKSGWEDDAEGDGRRDAFVQYLRGQRYSDRSSCLEWVEVAYGNDDHTALPTPPAGTRWREVEVRESYHNNKGHHAILHTVTFDGTRWCFFTKGGMRYDYASFFDMSSRHAAANWSDTVVRQCLALADNPPHSNTEPLPAPVVDRGSEVWALLRRSEGRWWSRGYVDCKSGDDSAGSEADAEADALLLALAPHWRELAALVGEKVPKVTVLEGWHNVYTTRSLMHPTKEAARKAAGDDALHTAVRLAVVEDAV